MNISVSGDTLVLSKSIEGNLELERLQFRDKPSGAIHIANMYGGLYKVRLPGNLEPGPYRLLCNGADVNNGKTIFIGYKPTVSVSTEKYTRFDNEHLYRHQIDFGQLLVQTETDFTIDCDGKKILLCARERSSHFDILLPQQRLRITLSEELKQLIDEPRRN